MAVLETPWFMKTKTSDLGRVNQVFEERYQRSLTLIEMKKRKSLVKIDQEMNELRRDFRRIRTEVDFSTDLDENGKPINTDELRSKSTGDLPVTNGSCAIDIEKLRTRSALSRSRRFANLARANRRKAAKPPIIELLKERYSQENEIERLQMQLRDKVKPKRATKIKRKKRRDPGKVTETNILTNGDDIANDFRIPRLPLLNGYAETEDSLSEMKDSSRDRRFSIGSPRKHSRDHLPAIEKANVRKRSLEV
ncbi:hypothetical protein DPMN_044607 [Dreissena polymorpha]|uniref:Uncharacterized protein n=1 Tax=Dreissena polymorpha TaxID=45954 RepID=A0A9D4D4T9_DREPO|nr:hypothetical protein DPMN_044607 [Dreissena polymorpha]